MMLEENKQFLKISKPKMDFSQYKEPICVGHRTCSFQPSKIKYFSDKMAKKPNGLGLKNSDENFNNSSLFASKTYSSISNSVLAYVVGGFVGSKSQMNHNNHNLLYDLSAVISNILNSSKCESEKTSLKKNENSYLSTSEDFQESSKFIVNESSQGKKENRNSVSDEVDFSRYIDVPLQNFIDKEKEACNYNKSHDSLIICDTIEIIQVLDEVCNNESSEYNSLEDVCMEIATAESLCEIQSQKGAINNDDTSSSDCEKNKLECCPAEDTSATQSNSVESHLNYCSPISPNDTDNKEIQKNVSFSIDFRTPLTTKSFSCSSNNWAKEKFRRQSECSVESTDSESFIVFEETCSSDGDKEKLYLNCDDDDDFESTICSEDGSSEEDSDDDEEDESDSDSGINSTTIDNYNSCLVNIEEKNKNNFQSHDDVKYHKFKVPKKVRFNDDIKVNKIIAWDHAYRTARVGPWEQMARDRFRFRERIGALSLIISPVLSTEHRTKIYNNLYS